MIKKLEQQIFFDIIVFNSITSGPIFCRKKNDWYLIPAMPFCLWLSLCYLSSLKVFKDNKIVLGGLLTVVFF